jgi:hypothetical protein
MQGTFLISKEVLNKQERLKRSKAEGTISRKD